SRPPGTFWKNASSCPSPDDEVRFCCCSLVVNRSNPPLPSASCQKRFLRSPSLLEPNAIRLPSGVHTGLWFTLPSNVNRVSVSLDRSYNQIWLSSSTATRRPSGDNRG